MNDPSQFLLYTAPNGAVNVDVFFKDETAWLTQKALAEAGLPVFLSLRDMARAIHRIIVWKKRAKARG